MKPFAHFLILAAVLNAVGQFSLGPGATLARSFIEPGHHVLFGASTAARLHNGKAYVVILALIAIIGHPTLLKEHRTTNYYAGNAATGKKTRQRAPLQYKEIKTRETDRPHELDRLLAQYERGYRESIRAASGDEI